MVHRLGRPKDEETGKGECNAGCAVLQSFALEHVSWEGENGSGRVEWEENGTEEKRGHTTPAGGETAK